MQYIIARKFGLPKLSFNSEDFGFDQDDFNQFFEAGREVVASLKSSTNLTSDYGEDLFLQHLTVKCLELFGELLPLLVHIVYRILDHEIENNVQFAGSDISLSED